MILRLAVLEEVLWGGDVSHAFARFSHWASCTYNKAKLGYLFFVCVFEQIYETGIFSLLFFLITLVFVNFFV